MDHEVGPDESTREAPPHPLRVMPAQAAASFEPAIIDPAEHNVVFTSLVTSDKDIVGLVAYSIYKQNKYDWLTAFGKQTGRMPDEAEAQSYLLGESTSRRLATYRHLAEATLDGRGVDLPGGARASPRALGGGDAGAARSMPPNRVLLVGLIVAILVVIGILWAFHSGGAPPAKL